MENEFNNTQEADVTTASNQRKEIGLPLIALGLASVPFVSMLLDSLGLWIPSSTTLVVIVSPIAGMIAGVASLTKGKSRIGMLGKILAIIAIVIPLSIVAFIIIFFIGVATGQISLM